MPDEDHLADPIILGFLYSSLPSPHSLYDIPPDLGFRFIEAMESFQFRVFVFL